MNVDPKTLAAVGITDDGDYGGMTLATAMAPTRRATLIGYRAKTLFFSVPCHRGHSAPPFGFPSFGTTVDFGP